MGSNGSAEPLRINGDLIFPRNQVRNRVETLVIRCSRVSLPGVFLYYANMRFGNDCSARVLHHARKSCTKFLRVQKHRGKHEQHTKTANKKKTTHSHLDLRVTGPTFGESVVTTGAYQGQGLTQGLVSYFFNNLLRGHFCG